MIRLRHGKIGVKKDKAESGQNKKYSRISCQAGQGTDHE